MLKIRDSTTTCCARREVICLSGACGSAIRPLRRGIEFPHHRGNRTGFPVRRNPMCVIIFDLFALDQVRYKNKISREIFDLVRLSQDMRLV